MNGVREFLKSGTGRIIGLVIVVLCIAAAAKSIWSNVGQNSTISDINNPLFIDSVTGKTFHMKLKVGMSIPVISPYTGKRTGYLPEFCYWTKDGHVKSTPTPVLMNDDVGKPGPTFCPDCGRLVVHHNPMAIEGHRPPPTRAEWEKMHHEYGG